VEDGWPWRIAAEEVENIGAFNIRHWMRVAIVGNQERLQGSKGAKWSFFKLK
jgi:hypothetical protein